MSTSEPFSGEQPTEEELRAAYEEEIKKILRRSSQFE